MTCTLKNLDIGELPLLFPSLSIIYREPRCARGVWQGLDPCIPSPAREFGPDSPTPGTNETAFQCLLTGHLYSCKKSYYMGICLDQDLWLVFISLTPSLRGKGISHAILCYELIQESMIKTMQQVLSKQMCHR